MPNPANASFAITEAHERRNVFLAPDGACDLSTRGDARRDVEPIRPPADQAGAPFHAGAHDPSRRGNRLARRRRRDHPTALVRRSAAALAIAVVTAALLRLALAQPDLAPPRASDGARPATAPPAAVGPHDVLRRPGVAEAAQPRHTPMPRARSRLKPTTRAPARRTAPRRTRTRARPSSPSPAPPVPSPRSNPAPSPIPAPSRAAPRAPALPVPVPATAPPEFM